LAPHQFLEEPEIIRDYQEIITEMQQIQVPHYIEKQFWVYRNDHFDIYLDFHEVITPNV